jgi:PAS domain S-box-containing protein
MHKDIMKKETEKTHDISLKDLLDIPTFQKLSDNFSQLTGMTIAFLDLTGEILIASGWQKICTEFHRKNPTTALRCLESDTILAGQLSKESKYNIYKCKNGLVDVAVPIILEGTHVGNLFAGQFLFEPPDIDFFSRQAEEFGFDKKLYLDELLQVPVFSMERVKQAISYLENLIVIIGKYSLYQKKLFELNEQLEQRVLERTSELEESNVRFQSLSKAAFEGIAITKNGVILDFNETLCEMFGYQPSEIINKPVFNFIHPEDIENAKSKVISGYERPYEIRCLRKDNSPFPVEVQAKMFTYKGEEVRVTAIRDITERKRAEEEIKQLRGILPICSFCKKIRDDKGYWEQVDVYIDKHSQADFSHSICPDCMKEHFLDKKNVD